MNSFKIIILLSIIIILSSPLHPVSLCCEASTSDNAEFIEETDEIHCLSHVGDWPGPVLFAGDAGDTFFVVFEIPVSCSVKYIETMWDTPGSVTAFAAEYNPACSTIFFNGYAPPRNYGAPCPIGDLITVPSPIYIIETGGWVTLPLPQDFLVGISGGLQPVMFGIALAKNSSSAKPLAESVTSTGYTYTWFGGLWCSNPWGAYSANFAVSIVELQMRLWVTYPWGMPIIAENIKQQPDTYDTNGPFHITCTLTDDGAGFTPQDFAELVYEVNHTNQQRIQLADESGGIYGADIVINGSIDDDIVYWIHTIDETGLEYESAAKSFTILSPENPFTDVLLVFDNLGAEREYPYISFLEENDYVPEIWDADEHKGIDASVILNGWNTMIVIGDGSGLIPAYSGGDSPFAQFLDIGGALLYIDQDYFAGNNLPQFGGFNPGDFAHDYLGISGFANDPWYPNLPPDTVYYGVTNNPVSGSFALSPYALYCLQNGMEQDEIKPDCFTPGNGTACFQGGYYGSYQGILYDNGFKTVYLAFPAEAGCEIDVNPLSYTYGMWLPTMQFDTLLSNISACFNVLEVDKTVNAMIHVEYALHQNYPNPFNPTTTIKYELPEMSEIKLTIYNIQGQEVLVLQEGLKQAGYHKIVWNGISADGVPVTSGLYFCKFTAKGQISGKNYNRISKMLLIK